MRKATILACLFLVPCSGVCQTGVPTYLTEEDANNRYAFATDIETPSAELGLYDTACSTSIFLDGTAAVAPWQSGTDVVSSRWLRTQPADVLGSAIDINDPALSPSVRLQITASVTLVTTAVAAIEVVVTFDTKFFTFPVGAQVDGQIGLRRTGTTGTALRDVDKFVKIRLGFRSLDGPVTIDLCAVSLEVVVINW